MATFWQQKIEFKHKESLPLTNMVEMVKAHGLNIYGYLKFLLEHRPGKDMTDEQLADLAPWREKLQSIKNRM